MVVNDFRHHAARLLGQTKQYDGYHHYVSDMVDRLYTYSRIPKLRLHFLAAKA